MCEEVNHLLQQEKHNQNIRMCIICILYYMYFQPKKKLSKFNNANANILHVTIDKFTKFMNGDRDFLPKLTIKYTEFVSITVIMNVV